MVPTNWHIKSTADSQKLVIIFGTSFGQKSSYDPLREINPSENQSLKIHMQYSTWAVFLSFKF